MSDFNTKNLVPIGGYSRNLMRIIDDMEWEGGIDDNITALKGQLKELQNLEREGETWYPLF